ncbi:MAG: sporulation protein [Defluviitaleaceae bacterium]|nr:sporulation protein [Defluviitaleaceae bacterium]
MANAASSNLEVLFSKMENFISSKTVVGEPIEFGNTIILPLVDVVFGVGAGGNEGKQEPKDKSGSLGGVGAKIMPSAVLVINDGNVQLVNIKNQDSMNKLVDMVPGILGKLSGIFNKNEEEDPEDFDIEFVNE